MKNADVFLSQTALKSLGFDPGPIDGVDGPKTRLAKDAWLASLAVEAPSDSLQVQRWNDATIAPKRLTEVKAVVSRILKNKARYEAVARQSAVPWFVIAGLHNMESGGDFTKHLHEGSPLTGRTRDIPKGRPLAGNPPFTWEDSAIDALSYDKMGLVNWSSLDASLYAVERFNGTGYLKYHPETPSPYLWAGTTVEKPGKYTADGKWDGNARSKQIGVAAIWKQLQAEGVNI